MKRNCCSVIFVSEVLLAVVLAAVVIRLLFAFTQPDFVLCIDDSPVYAEEFSLFLRENFSQYEEELCTEHEVDDSKALVEMLEGGETEYQHLLTEKNVEHMTEVRVKQRLAIEYGVIEDFSWEWLLQQMEDENKDRMEKIAAGEPVYGLREFSVQQYYSYFMSNLELTLIDVLPENLIGVATSDVDAYYAQFPSFSHVEGERIHYTLYDITQATGLPTDERERVCNDVRQTLVDGQQAVIEVAGIVFAPQQLNLNSTELRSFVRQDLESEFLLSLAPGEVTEVFTIVSPITNAPKTGDNSPLWVLTVVLCLSIAGMLVMIIHKKRRNDE